MEQNEIIYKDVNFQHNSKSFQKPLPGIIQFVIKHSRGLIKNEKQANYVLFGFVIISIIISSYLFFNKDNKLTLEERQFQDIPSEKI